MNRIARKSLGWVAAGALALGGATSAMAEGLGLYATAGFGVVSMDSSNFVAIGDYGSYQTRDAGYKIGVGLQVSENMAVEFDGRSLGKFGSAAKLETLAGTLWLVGIGQVSERIRLQGKLGTTAYRSEVGAAYHNGGGMVFGVGLNYRIISNMDIAYEYERFPLEMFDAESSFDVYSVGLKYHF